ncbi:hypothetical protein ENBRE01_0878 [Enteropsectra breve]|nr:hypothetical protein ENBRE01_0878 [Enteropsectra breve]
MNPIQAMIKSGRYEVVELLNISHSLHSQREEEPPSNSNTIYKVLIQSVSKSPAIVYLTDGDVFGPGTVLEVHKDLDSPLLTQNLYRIIKRAAYAFSTGLVKALKSHASK